MTITRDNVIATVLNLFPILKDEVEMDNGVYETLGCLAIYLGEGIEKNTISDTIVAKAIKFMNALAENQDLEVQNMLVAGVFETLSNYDRAIDRIKGELSPDGIRLYDRYCL